MSQPFLAEIRIFSFNFPPKGWAFANGQLLPINQNQALFSLMGTFYGGDGIRTFGLPNLQGRVALHQGNSFVIGQQGGEQAVTLIASHMPSHTHTVQASNSLSGTRLKSPVAGTWAPGSADQLYSAAGGATLSPAAFATAGGSQPHENMMPYLTLTFCIALQGIYPSQN